LLGRGLGISSPPNISKTSRGGYSYISKSIHKATMDVAKGRKLSLYGVLREKATLKWFLYEVVIF